MIAITEQKGKYLKNYMDLIRSCSAESISENVLVSISKTLFSMHLNFIF